MLSLEKDDQIQVKKEWIPANVTSKDVSLRSYQVETESGQTFRRNRRFLHPLPK